MRLGYTSCSLGAATLALTLLRAYLEQTSPLPKGRWYQPLGIGAALLACLMGCTILTDMLAPAGSVGAQLRGHSRGD